MMGADAPIPPVMMNGRRPRGGAPAAASGSGFFPETELVPPFRTEALRRGALIIPVFTGFYSVETVYWSLTPLGVPARRASAPPLWPPV